jgi:hypothetical protein
MAEERETQHWANTLEATLEFLLPFYAKKHYPEL